MENPTNPPEGRLLKVYPPEGTQDNTSIDIIAIHGLGTTTPRTWEYKTKTRSVNWLSDSNMLPDIVPSARIYTFSWNARYYADASVARLENVAEVLLSNLQSQRDKDDTHSRPLIFVASCFGGLVVTKALEIVNIYNSQYRKLLVANTGVVFLGSPLQGTKAGKAAQWQAMLGGILNKGPSRTLLQDLDGSTRALRETSERFVRMVTTPPMQTMTMCFWESHKTQVLKAVLPATTLTLRRSIKMIIVEEDSACLFGRPKQILDAPHSMMNKFSGPDDANFGLVSNAVKKMVEKAKSIAVSQREVFHLHNEHFMVSRRPNPIFTGRVEELGKLKRVLCPSLSTAENTAVPKIYVIHGMGGAGKSEVALRFAHENRPEFWGIFWIDARSNSSITSGFVNLARMCGHNDESLEDNADNKDLDLARFLPAGRNGSILITTRLIECGKHQTVGKDGYESLSHGTAIELLLKACGIDSSSRSAEEDNARAVAELLGYHALAIIQAGAAICEGYCNLGEYKENFLEHRQTLLDCFPGQAGSEYGGVYATFEVTVTYLEARGDQIAKDALQLLNFYAFMHFSEFPEAAFEEAWKNSRDEDVVSSSLLPDGSEDIYNLAPWHVSHLPAFMHQNPHNIKLNKIRLRQARSLLASLSLVTFDSARASTRMHPVSHFWSRDRLQIPDESMNAGLSGLSVLSLSIKYPYAVDIDPLVRQLQPHIESIVHSLKEWGHHKHSFHFQQSVYRLGYVMYRSGLDSALFEMLQMIPIQTDEFWIRTRNGQSIQLLHGTYTLESGDANKAVTLLEQINEARLQTLAPEDPDLLSSQHTLAMAYLDIEDVAKAIELLEQIVQTRNETLSPEHPGLLGSQHELARAYLKIDETIKAIALLESVVEIEAKTLRPEHPDLLISQSVLAGAYLNIKETAKAIALLEEVVDIETKTLRPEHSDRLVSQHELARAYLEIEETAKAIAILESVVSIRTRTLRPEHPDLLSSQHELARAYLRIDEAAKAIDLLEEVVEVKKRTLRPKHRELLVSQHELARAYLQIDETTKAITLLEKVVEIRTKTLRPEHSDLLASQHVLASAYLDIEETAKAIALLEPVVEIRARTLKADHPNRVRSIYLLARCHRKAGNYERAIQLARSIENIAQNRAGEDFADWNRELIGYILEEMDLEETSS